MTEEEKMNGIAQQIVAQAKKEKKIIRLHHHPDAIKQSIRELKEMSEEEGMKNLFEDVEVLLDWAFARLPIVTPPYKEEGEPVA